VTGRTAFTDEEWDLLREAPEDAGLIVISSDRGGTFRETFALAKAFAEARKEHGASELLDELVGAGPKSGKRFHSSEELHEHGLQRLRDAHALLAQKATPAEADDYRAFVVALAERVAAAHKENGEDVSERERAAIDEIEAALKS
jgi:thioredoxin-like negative regulator of GroEL